jgi:hypothetical protein
LLDQVKFRNYFKEKVTPSQERWHAFLNNLDEHHLDELRINLIFFEKEIEYILNNTDINDQRVFEFLNRLSSVVHSMWHTKLGYDETKPLARFLWEIFAGWDWVKGYQTRDVIDDMINAI